MSGFENDIVYAKNADFSQSDNQAVSEANGLVTDGQMWIGATAMNAGGTHINVGTITSPNSSATIGYSSPNVTVQVNATTKITTFNSDGSWTIDPRTVKVDMYAWSGGSGGGAGRNGVSASAAGGGGGSGSFAMMSFNASGLTGSPYSVTIGQGGAGAASQNGTNTAASPGAQGTATTLGSILNTGLSNTETLSTGATGSYLSNGLNSNVGNGGSGTATNGSTATAVFYGAFSGGAGGPGYTSGTPRTGLPGGAIVDLSSNTIVAGGLGGTNAGGNGGNGNSPPADAPIHIGGTGGGAGGTDGGAVSPIAGSGGNGGFPGGGGGGGAGNLNLMASGAGGNGANGQLKIVEYF